jgi:hypothetical protein
MKRMEWKPYERIGIAVLRFSDEQILKDMENVIRTIEFYIWDENTPQPLSRGELEDKKEVWFNFQNYW